MNIQIQPIAYTCPLRVFSLFQAEKGAMFLGSGLQHPEFGRYSYIAVDPYEFFTLKDDHDEDMAVKLKSWLRAYAQPLIPDLPPFQGGMAGAFAYEFYRYIEDVNIHTVDDMGVPDMAVGLFDVVISFDHLQKKAWIISTGFPETEPQARQARARERLGYYLHRLHVGVPHDAPMFNEPIRANIESNFTQPRYEAAVQTVMDYILAGDIFEANLSQRFQAELPENFSSFDFFVQLYRTNPAPFAAYINLGDMQILSISPERFVRLSQGQVETRPIKGTCRRGETAEQDIALAEALKRSEKDNAENIMIVDLLRNDLSKVCEDHSVDVTQLCGVETYTNVHHLVSVIKGQLTPHHDAIDLLWALFPGGSITGAPKIRAMQIIAEMEKINRGIYCGSIGYIGFNGEMDTSIAIRTATVKQHRMVFQAGGAIVADSDPRSEYEETLTKSSGFGKLFSTEKAHDFID
ncbi:MAG: aminodeoxychorismate synthase component I [Gammaproteobacteria bacterium]